jgi:hypothetical protein
MKRKPQTAVVAIQRCLDDPVCPRVYAGGSPNVNYYLNFRGKPEDALVVLDAVRVALASHIGSGEPFFEAGV